MRPVKVRFTPRARDDISEIHDWLAERSSSGAIAVVQAIRSSAALIGDYPAIGRATNYEGVKVLAVMRYPYLVYYTIDAGEAVVVHIRHGARDKPSTGDL